MSIIIIIIIISSIPKKLFLVSLHYCLHCLQILNIRSLLLLLRAPVSFAQWGLLQRQEQ